MSDETDPAGSTRVFANGSILVGGAITPGDVVVELDRIVAVGTGVDKHLADVDRAATEIEQIDCRGLLIAPGFIDLQCNGAVGCDITTQPESIGLIASALPRFGITSWLPTVVTCPASSRSAAIAALAEWHRTHDAAWPRKSAEPIGLHFEGPMIARDRLGAHDARFVDVPEQAELDGWTSSGAVSLVTLAPEVPGALDVISRLTDAGIVVSAGHTAMTAADLAAARAAGLSYVTHLFNAMTPFGHRAPGPIGAVLADTAIVAGIIADGLHVDPVAVKMAWNALGPGRMSLVSDAVGALGMEHGTLRVGSAEITFDDTGVRTAGGVLAGSALALDRAVRNLIAWTGCSAADALGTVTSTPADLLGLTDRGRLKVGARADMVLLDDALDVVDTVIGGTSATGHAAPGTGVA